jgi:hypothetical protein
MLYPELRNIIFANALTEYADLTRPYSKHEYYYRPGFEFVKRIDTDLLLTCRLVYLEMHLIPIALNEHVFWMHRGPSGRIHNRPRDHNTYFVRMTPEQRATVHRVRFFTQLNWLQGREAQEWAPGLAVYKLTITIRHSDWWKYNREDGEHLHIKPPQEGWGGWIGSFPGLQELELEFETTEPKWHQLKELVRVALEWKFPMKDGDSLIYDGEGPAKSSWKGTSSMSLSHGAGTLPLFQPQNDATLDRTFPLDLKLHVRKLKLVKESWLLSKTDEI